MFTFLYMYTRTNTHAYVSIHKFKTKDPRLVLDILFYRIVRVEQAAYF